MCSDGGWVYSAATNGGVGDPSGSGDRSRDRAMHCVYRRIGDSYNRTRAPFLSTRPPDAPH